MIAEVFDAILARTSAREVAPALLQLAPEDRQTVLCTVCAMRDLPTLKAGLDLRRAVINDFSSAHVHVDREHLNHPITTGGARYNFDDRSNRNGDRPALAVRKINS